ncbi:hypothetical protein GF389_01385 [Candidatus Dojkabacteria bacterium]|nr:hypothetical protein [Candidatus Dojkabacteria bacterium]
MRTLLQFLTDSIVVTMMVALVIFAFLATFALSPISYEESIFAKSEDRSVLGDLSGGELKYEPKWENNENLEFVQERVDGGEYTLTLSFEDLKKQVNVGILEITNDSSKRRKLIVRAASSQAISEDLEVSLMTEGIRSELDVNSDKQEMFVLKAGEGISLSFILDSKNNLNFRSEVVLEFFSTTL